MKLKLQQCALCRCHEKLELSHIVPKMVPRKLKKSSVAGIRNTSNPNVNIQDGEKHYMLCGTCEDLFSSSETYFANTLFHPYLNKITDTFSYDEKLFYCLTSISWRSLYLDLIDFVQNKVVGLPALIELIKCEEIMRDFLLNKRQDVAHIENHIFFFDEITAVSGSKRDKYLRYPHTTFHRGITSYTFCYEKEEVYGTITSMMGIILFTIYSKPQTEIWDNTMIYKDGGTIRAGNQHIKSIVGNELANIMEVCQSATDALSDKQRDLISQRTKDAGTLFANSSIFRDLQLDQSLK